MLTIETNAAQTTLRDLIVATFIDENRPVSVREVMGELGLPESCVHNVRRILRSMKQRYQLTVVATNRKAEILIPGRYEAKA